MYNYHRGYQRTRIKPQKGQHPLFSEGICVCLTNTIDCIKYECLNDVGHISLIQLFKPFWSGAMMEIWQGLSFCANSYRVPARQSYELCL